MYLIGQSEFHSVLLGLTPRRGTLHAHAATPLQSGVNGYQPDWLFRYNDGESTIYVQAGDVSRFVGADDLTITCADRLIVGLFDPTPDLRNVIPFVRSVAKETPNAVVVVFTNKADQLKKENAARFLLDHGAAHFCVVADQRSPDVGRFVLAWFLNTIRSKREACYRPFPAVTHIAPMRASA